MKALTIIWVLACAANELHKLERNYNVREHIRAAYKNTRRRMRGKKPIHVCVSPMEKN